MTSIFRHLFVLCLLLTGQATYAADISGTYVGLYSNAADLLQIVQRADGSALGRFEQVMLAPAGTSIERMNATVTGAVSGDTLVLSMKPAKFLGGTIPMSGTISGETLRLSGGVGSSSFNAVLKLSEESLYMQQVQKLTMQANTTATADAAQKAQVREQRAISDVVKWMRDYSKIADVHLRRLPKAPAFCAEVTKKMQAALVKERSFPPGSYARGQVDYAIGSMDYQFNSWHFNLQSVESSFGYSDGRITQPEYRQATITQALAYCRAPDNSAMPLCESFSSAYVSYQATAGQLEQALRTAETAWQVEHTKQKAIEKQANVLSD